MSLKFGIFFLMEKLNTMLIRGTIPKYSHTQPRLFAIIAGLDATICMLICTLPYPTHHPDTHLIINQPISQQPATKHALTKYFRANKTSPSLFSGRWGQVELHINKNPVCRYLCIYVEPVHRILVLHCIVLLPHVGPFTTVNRFKYLFI